MMQVTVGRLGHGDIAALARLLDRDPVATVYLRSELRLNLGSSAWWGVSDGADLRAAVLTGPLTVPWIPDPADAHLVADALVHAGQPRMMVGDRGSVLSLHGAMRPPRHPRQIRDPQPVLVLDAAAAARLHPDPRAVVRRATRADLEQLIVAAAAMHREEMGTDPLVVDPDSWRARMTMLVDRGWSWIWTEGGSVVFKAELSAWMPDCAQIQGVWVAPRFRRQGRGTAGMIAVVADLLSRVASCSLYVNSYNTPALRLYEGLGFVPHGDFASVFY